MTTLSSKEKYKGKLFCIRSRKKQCKYDINISSAEYWLEITGEILEQIYFKTAHKKVT